MAEHTEQISRDTHWQQAVNEWAQVMEQQATTPWFVAGKPGQLGWQLVDLPGGRVRVQPIAWRRGHRRRRVAVRRLRLDEVLHRWNAIGDAEYVEIAQLLQVHEADAHYTWRRAAAESALQRALVLLEGRTDVYRPGDDSPIRVRSTQASLHVRCAGDEAFVQAMVRGEAITAEQAGRLARQQIKGTATWWRQDEQELWLVRMAPTVLAGMQRIGRGEHSVPLHAGQRLARAMVPASRRGEVTIAPDLRGDREVANVGLFAHLSWLSGLVMRLMVRPLPGSAATLPGEGDKVWYGERGERLLWCERDLNAEVELAGQLWRTIFDAEPRADGTFVTRVRERDEALDLVARIRSIGDREDGLSVVWETVPLQVNHQSMEQLRLNVTSGQAFFDASVQITDGTVVVPLQQAMAAIAQKQRYVQLADGSWQRLGDRLRAKLSKLPTGAQERMVLTAPQLQELEEAGLEVEGLQGWREVREAIDAAAAWRPKMPSGLRAKLRLYQRDGVRWMLRLARWAPGCVLADEMGLGKTVQVIALLLARARKGPQLVVAPTSLLFNWQAELKRFAPSLNVVEVRSRTTLDRLDLLGRGDVVLTTWTSLALNIGRFKAHRWATVGLDEAQAMKNPSTRRARAVVALQKDFTVAITGTPMENRTAELWSVMRGTVPGLLGSRQDFQQRFVVPIEAHGLKDASAELAAWVRPFILRRMKSEVAAELPRKLESTVQVTLSAENRRRYEGLREASRQALTSNDLRARQLVLAALTRLRQLACDRRLVDPEHRTAGEKLSALRTVTREAVEAGHKVLVFSQFTSLLDLARKELKAAGLRCLQIDGRTPAGQRKDAVATFERGRADVMLLSIRAAGVGLNLVAADTVMHLDPWWNPAVEDQATDRAHRIGQRRAVHVYRFVAQGTVEEKIYKLHRHKRDMLQAVLQGTDAGAPITFEELRDLLDDEPVGGKMAA